MQNTNVQISLDDPALYINREMSWLAFNARVLDQAEDRFYPLLERLKFLAIHAANLDEFFMIRVSGLHEQLEAAVTEASPDGVSPRDQLTRIRAIVDQQCERARRLLASDLLPELARHGIHIIDFAALDAEQRERANDYFRRSVFPVLTPLAVDPGHPFPFVSNLSLSLAVEIVDDDSPECLFARVKVPESLPRFIEIDALGKPPGSRTGEQRYLPLEQLIEANLAQLFPECQIAGCYPFRVTRDMDLEILADGADNLMSVIDRELRRRRFGACVRLEVDIDIPQRIRQLFMGKLEIDEEDVYPSSSLLGLAALMAIAQQDRPELKDQAFVPRVPAQLADKNAVFSHLRASDVLLHHPYDSFMPVLESLAQAATDPSVLAIKMTLYRAGANAEVVRTLIRAAENGKQVAVSTELKARFDEENNIAWARTLERAGVHVFYGNAGIKTHAKIALVVRREGDTLQRYVHLSTGNYNASTARLYTDFGVLTSNAELGDDVCELFNSLSGFSKQTTYRKIAVAPVRLVDTILSHIEEQTAEARAGRPARIIAKMNSLVDGRVIRALYRASTAGVSIDLLVRGICCLRPGLPGVSENIRVRSIIGRFLEHERVFIFGPPGRERFYLSSADWMPRNFDRRVEVLFPLESEALRDKIRSESIQPGLRDDVRGYQLLSDGEYIRLHGEGVHAICAQALVLGQVTGGPGRLSSSDPRVLTPSHAPEATALSNEFGE